MSADYHRLRDRIDAFSKGVFERSRDRLACAEGCCSCCEVHLTVTRVEAREVERHLATLPPDRRDALAGRADREDRGDPRCVMLDDDGRCAIYEARPLVCRSQGLPLLYPEGFVPEAAVRARTKSGDVTVCPLNYVDAAPLPEDILDAGRVDAMLGLVDRLAREEVPCAGDDEPGLRVSLASLVRVPRA